ncbi:hypothetical protein [Streptomyces echinatus]|uniref:hypothetical protein n=1 Tax=Streptomyces echinatus TaxID=67293 RepID=UPI00380B0344
MAWATLASGHPAQTGRPAVAVADEAPGYAVEDFALYNGQSGGQLAAQRPMFGGTSWSGFLLLT